MWIAGERRGGETTGELHGGVLIVRLALRLTVSSLLYHNSSASYGHHSMSMTDHVAYV